LVGVEEEEETIIIIGGLLYLCQSNHWRHAVGIVLQAIDL
jgi:hypothetical protein